MTAAFEPCVADLTGLIIVQTPIDEAFGFFSPVGEKEWVQGWDFEPLFPRSGEWTKGMIFRTAPPVADALWLSADLDFEQHRVVYDRTERDLLVARVEVGCRGVSADATEVRVRYSYVGLSAAGNAEIERCTEARYAEKLTDWQARIAAALASSR